ncbi:MAG TPA: hypothetical protein VIC06_03600 [Solirubrobacteraceae bacterium]|jgi:hypothetical protein
MAQTKRKRQTKHRGNAAGVVESRGRTGRKPTTAEKSPEGRAKAKTTQVKGNRYDRPPTWSGAFYRAMAAAVLMLLISLFLIKKPGQAIAIFPIVLVLYVPISFYTDQWLYRRRQRNKARGGEKKAPG